MLINSVEMFLGFDVSSIDVINDDTMCVGDFDGDCYRYHSGDGGSLVTKEW